MAAVGNCCCGCNYFTDDYSTDNLATNYTTVSGAFSVGTGKLRSSIGGSLLLANATSGSNYHSHVVSVTMNTAGDVAHVIAGYLDPSNYLFVELSQGGGNVQAKLYKRVAGVNTQVTPTRQIYPALGIGVFPGGTIGVRICAGPDITSVLFDGVSRIESDAALSLGPYCGVAAVSVGSTIDFDNLTLAKHRVDSEACLACGDCPACIDDNSPYELQLVGPSDIANGTCGSCGNGAGTFIARKEYVAPGQQGCFYFGGSAPVCSGQGAWSAYFLQPFAPNWDGSAGPGTYRLRAILGAIAGASVVNVVYEKDFGSNRIDCLNLSSESLPWVGESGGGCTSSTHLPVLVSRA